MTDIVSAEHREAQVAELEAEIDRLRADLTSIINQSTEAFRRLRQAEPEVERLRAENEELRRWKAMDKPLTAAMAVIQSDMEKLRAEKKELTAALAYCTRPGKRARDALAKADKPMTFDRNVIVLIGLLAIVAMLVLILYAKAELIEPTNCGHLREGIAELEQKLADRGLSPSEIATLEYMRRWMDRERCDSKDKTRKKVGDRLG
jgi:hypothetical protein